MNEETRTSTKKEVHLETVARKMSEYSVIIDSNSYCNVSFNISIVLKFFNYVIRVLLAL